MKHLFAALLLLCGFGAAQAQTAIPNLPRITSADDGDLMIIEHLLGPPGNHTSGIALDDLALYMSNRIGFGALNQQAPNTVLAGPPAPSTSLPTWRALVDADIPQLYAKNASAAIVGGTIDGTAIGGTTPAAGTFAALAATGDLTLGRNLFMPGSFHLDTSLASPATGNALAHSSGGNAISYCPQLACVNTPFGSTTPTPSFYDHQRTSALFSSITSDDGHSEEQTVGIETTVSTGYARAYAATTAYALNDNVQVGNAVYRAAVAGTTGASSPPPSTRPTAVQGGNAQFTDGTVTWQWINDAAIDAKVGLYNEVQALGSKAGAFWGIANNTAIGAGVIPTFAANTELDVSNNSGQNCVLGTIQCYGIFMQIAGNIQTAGVYMSTANASNYSAYYGILLAGAKLASVADFEANGSGQFGVGICADGIATCTHSSADLQIGYSTSQPSMGPAAINFVGPHSSATISDGSTAPTALSITGTKSLAGIYHNETTPTGEYFGGTYANWQIQGTGWSVAPNGAITGAGVTSNGTVTATQTGTFGQGSSGYALVLSNASNLNGAIKVTDTASGGAVWNMGPGSGNGTTDWNLYNVTGTTVALAVTKAGAVTVASTINSGGTIASGGTITSTGNIASGAAITSVGSITAGGAILHKVSPTVSAAGTTQGTATALTSDINVVTTVAASSGVILTANVGQRQEVFNRGANALAVYPASGAKIEAGATNAAVSLATSGHAVFECVTATQCYQAP